ncbi:hypothetical protein CR513_01877, partial [Mucuna pruriens]
MKGALKKITIVRGAEVHNPLWEGGTNDMGKLREIKGNCKPKVYVDWELKVDQILGYFDLHGRMVVRLVTLELGDYDLVWWTQMLEDIRVDIRDPCKDWVALKKMMRDRFVLPSYTRDLYNELQRLYQGSRSMEEYHKEMEIGLMRAQIRESEEGRMTQFLHGLNREIEDVVELQHYSTLGELVHQTIKVEMKIRRRSAFRKTYVGSSGWKGKEKEKEKVRREKSPKKGSDPVLGQKEVASTPTTNAPRTSNIKCFKFLGKGHIALQCPIRRVIVMKDNGEVESESSRGEDTSITEAESLSDDSHYKGDLLVVRRL